MLYKLLQPVGPLELDLVAWFACGSCMAGKPALCGSCPLVTPYYCRLGDLLCFVFMSDYCTFDFFCVLFVPSVLWYCWLGLLTCKTRLPYNLYCVGGDVKHYSIQSKHAASPLTSATYVRKHAGPIRLRHACYVTVAGQHAAAASQPVDIGLLPVVAPTDLRSPHRICGKMSLFLFRRPLQT